MAYTVVVRPSVPALLVIAMVLLAIPAQATAQENLALGKPTSQSSVGVWSMFDDPAVESQGAVNATRTGWGFHTDEEENPWWQVDLGQPSTIDEIRVYNRTDGSQSRARTVRVLLSGDGSNWQEIYAHDGTTFDRLTIPANGTQARFVRLQLNEREWFHLAEVEVIGVPPDGPGPVPTVPTPIPSATPIADIPLGGRPPVSDIPLASDQTLVPGGDAGTNNNDAAAIPYNCRIDGAIASGDYDAFTFNFPGGAFRAASQGDLNLVADLIRASDGATLARHGTETQQFLIEGDLPADRYILTLRVMFHAGAGDYGVTLGAPGACAVRDLATATGPAGIPTRTTYSSDAQRLIGGVRDDPTNDELWGDLADVLQRDGHAALADGAWAVARILDQDDTEWSGHNPAVERAADAIRQLAITDDEWVGDLGDLAQAAGWMAAARNLYGLAMSLDPDDDEWQNKYSGITSPSPGVVTGGAPQSLVTQVLGDRDNDELWGDLGDAYQESGNGALATGSWAVARILDPDDGEWSGHNPNLDAAIGAIRQLGITDDEWIGDLADRAQSAGFPAAARGLYDAALTLDPADREWQKKATGSAR